MSSTSDHLADEIEALRLGLKTALAENEALKIKLASNEDAYTMLMNQYLNELRKRVKTVSIPVLGTIGEQSLK